VLEVCIAEARGEWTVNDLLLDIRGLKKYFTISGGFLSGRRSVVKAVDDVHLKIYRGETLGLVGERGFSK